MVWIGVVGEVAADMCDEVDLPGLEELEDGGGGIILFIDLMRKHL